MTEDQREILPPIIRCPLTGKYYNNEFKHNYFGFNLDAFNEPDDCVDCFGRNCKKCCEILHSTTE
jgi:hypothetical protein